MANSKYKAGDRVKFVAHGAMFGSVGTVMFVRKDGHLIVNFDAQPEGSAVFVDLTDVAPERRVTAGSAEPTKRSRAQIKREIDEVLARKPGGKVAKAHNRPQITDCPCVMAGECNCQRMHITERCECPACKESSHATIAKSRPWQGTDANERQVLLWIPFAPKGAMSVARPIPVDFTAKEVASVWTLPSSRNPSIPPALPLHPVHGRDAFLEDYGHDWTVRAGNFIYRSRITDQPTWVLVQLKQI